MVDGPFQTLPKIHTQPLQVQFSQVVLGPSPIGIFFGAMGDLFQAANQTGFSRTTTYNGTLNNGLDGYPYSLANPFPAAPLPALGAGLGADTNVGGSIAVVLPHPKDLYVQRWTFGVQRELPERIVLSIAYTGDRGVHLTTNKNLDALPNQYLSTLPTRDTTTINYLGAQIPNPFKGLVPAGTSLYTNSTIARSSLLAPYPLFTGITYNTQQGSNMYNSLQVNAERRFANGFTGTFVFTWQNDMEATSFLNAGDPLPEKLPATTDFPVYFSASGIYSLPIGHGRMLLGNSSRLVNALLGGWQIEGVYRYQSGPALGFGNALLNGTCPTLASIRPTSGSAHLFEMVQHVVLQHRLEPTTKQQPDHFACSLLLHQRHAFECSGSLRNQEVQDQRTGKR